MMSRRDTILIAIFVNTGVLGLLFLMGVNKEESTVPSPAAEIVQISTLPKLEVAEATPIVIARPYEELPEIEDEADFDFEQDHDVVTETTHDTTTFPHGFFEVKVKRGDFLEKIARANGTTVEELKKVNHLTSEKIAVGQVLRIPNKKEKTSEPLVAAKTNPVSTPSQQPKVAGITHEGEPVYYVVKSGDNPWKIAKQFNIRVDQLLKLNSLDEGKAKNLKVGDRLRVK